MPYYRENLETKQMNCYCKSLFAYKVYDLVYVTVRSVQISNYIYYLYFTITKRANNVTELSKSYKTIIGLVFQE